MHYGAWLDGHGIPREPPYFMAHNEARGRIGPGGAGDPGMPSLGLSDSEGQSRPARGRCRSASTPAPG